MSIQGQDELRVVGRIIQKRARASLMSDTKWRKLITVLNEPERGLRHYILKFIDGRNEMAFYYPLDLKPPRPWTAFPGWGPVPLRSIEWMFIPRLAKYPSGHKYLPDREVTQDVDSFFVTLSAIGRFPAQLSERGLLITGHQT